jgi:hypothetical protein
VEVVQKLRFLNNSIVCALALPAFPFSLCTVRYLLYTDSTEFTKKHAMSMTKEQATLRLESIGCFESTAQVIMAEQVLLEAAFRVRVMPTPASMRFLP